MGSSQLGCGRSSAHRRVQQALARPPHAPTPRRLPVPPAPRLGAAPHAAAPGPAQPPAGEPQPPTAEPAQAASPQPSALPSSPAPSPGPAAATAAAAVGSAAAAPAPAAPAPGPAAASAAAPAAAAAAAKADDDFARGWRPPPGDPPLWWVEKFEKRRKAEAERKAADPSFVTSHERVAASLGKGGPAATPARGGGNPVMRFLGAALQAAQLLLVLSLLLLLPAAVHDGGLTLTRPFTTLAAYLCFFGLGSVGRVVRHGPLAPRAADRQVASWPDRLALAAFVVVLPLLHWYGMYRYATLALYTDTVLPYSTTLYDVVGGVGMALAVALNAAASRELGRAYDRIVAPPALVTTGPYKFVQHPIYASYMLLFASYGLWCHSAPTALAALAVCALYYSRRTVLEAGVLQAAFGSEYSAYAARTRRFVPMVV